MTQLYHIFSDATSFSDNYQINALMNNIPNLFLMIHRNISYPHWRKNNEPSRNKYFVPDYRRGEIEVYFKLHFNSNLFIRYLSKN